MQKKIEKNNFDHLRKYANNFQDEAKYYLACEVWEEIIIMDKFIIVSDILNYAECLEKVKRIEDALKILKEKENLFPIASYYLLWAKLCRSSKDFLGEKIHLENFFSLVDKIDLVAKKAMVRYVDLLAFELDLSDEALIFAKKKISDNPKDPWFLKLELNAKKREVEKKERDAKKNTILEVGNSLNENKEDLTKIERNLFKLVVRKDPIRIFAGDFSGILELLSVRALLNKDQFELNYFSGLIERVKKLSNACSSYRIDDQVPHLLNLRLYIKEFSELVEKMEMPNYILSSSGWSIVTDFFVSFGFFVSALKAKEFLLDALIDEASKEWNDKSALKIILGLLERGDISRAKIWGHIFFEKTGSDVPNYVKNAISIYSGEINKLIQSNSNSYKKFSSMIEGKRVAIVGPGHTDFNFGEEIDSYDFVARNNVIEHSFGDAKKYGQRVDISYYATGVARRYAEKIKQLQNQIAFLVFKADVKFAEENGKRIGLMPPLFKGAANQLPIMLYDLCFSGAEEIKIFCMDFHCSKKPYSSSYIHTKFNFLAYVCHEPIGCLSISRAIWKNSKNVYADDQCESVLKLTNQEYAKKMQELHCHDIS